MDAIEWAKKVDRLGAGELLVTSIDRDGTEKGYDLTLTKMINESVGIPVIASGGCGRLEHFLDVFRSTDVDAALAASVFHYGEYPIPTVKSYLKKNGIVIRA